MFISLVLKNIDAYQIGFWIEHTKHIIIEASTVKGEESVIENLDYILKLLTKAKLVQSYRSDLKEYIAKFKQRYRGKQRLNSDDHDEIIIFIRQLENAIEFELNRSKDIKDNAHDKIADSTAERVYRTGQAYDIYRDILDVIKNAQAEVFVIDSYPNEELIDVYLSKAKEEVSMSILLNIPKGNFNSVAEKFHVQRKDHLEVRQNTNVHDRMFFIDNRCCVIAQ